MAGSYAFPASRPCHYWWAVSMDHGTQDDEFWQALPAALEVGFVEDVATCRNMQIMLDGETEAFNDLQFASDIFGTRCCCMIEHRVQEEYGA
ncbi:hypothetical protein [Sphingorhabdus sp. YGSMI21]|uniref:hypothetical protein n=1 Tax=Sphingorhabdus sp. YGSMI21 TaxID=2077182 RepID=UPI001F0BAEB2|nr:hypothetical protein [Sphingorhabdus sp. YGSMI21]